MATLYPRYTYIISKTLDPLFALFIGVSAAGIRIRREEKEKGRSGALAEIVTMGKRRVGRLWGVQSEGDRVVGNGGGGI